MTSFNKKMEDDINILANGELFLNTDSGFKICGRWTESGTSKDRARMEHRRSMDGARTKLLIMSKIVKWQLICPLTLDYYILNHAVTKLRRC